MTFLELFKQDVTIEKDVPYLDDGHPRHVLDVYTRAGFEKRPVVVWFYGGGWRSGDKRLFEHLGRAFVVRDAVAVTVNYRLTPEVTYPSHAEDCAAAVAWVVKNIERYGGDPGSIYLTGHSAGAHLAVMLVLDEDFLKNAGVARDAIDGVVAISGASDLLHHVDSTVFTKPEHIREAFGSSEDELREASPLFHARSGLPPFLVIVAENDPEGLREQGKDLVEALREKGNTVVFLSVRDRDHLSIVRRFGPSDDATANAIGEFVEAVERGRLPQ